MVSCCLFFSLSKIMPTLRLGLSHENFVFLLLLFVADNHVYPYIYQYKARIIFFFISFHF